MADFNGYTAKLKNRRVMLLRATDGDGYLLNFKRLGRRELAEPRTVVTELTLSGEAMAALVFLYHTIQGDK